MNIKILASISIFSLLNITLFIIFLSNFTENFDYKENRKTKSSDYKINSNENDKPNNYKYNIFFGETNSNREYFSSTQICGIESAALNNPLALINVYSVKAKMDKKWLKKYPNIKIIQLDLVDLFKGSIFENWYKLNANIVNNSPYKYMILSEVIRLVLLWKHGGYYSDLDTITIKSIEPLLKYNGAGLCQESPIEINVSNLLFSKNHTFLSKWMKLSIEKFNPNEPGSISQFYFWQNVEKICNVDIKKIPKVEIEKPDNQTDKLTCDFYFFPTKYFSPYNWNLFEKYFISNSKIEISRFLEAYSIHFFSSHSDKSKIFFRSNNIYEFFAKNNCPIFYEDKIINGVN